MEKEKTMIEIYQDDKIDLIQFKLKCKAKNMPEAINKLIKLIKK